MAKPHLALRAKMLELGIEQTDLAKVTRICPSSLSLRFQAKTPWRIDEIYTVMDFMKLPYEDMSKYFPKDGKRNEI